MAGTFTTETVRLQVDVLPQSSVARYTRVTLYVPQLMFVVVSVKVTSTSWSQASLAVTAGQAGSAGHSIVTSAAQAIVGGVMSLIDTERLQVEVLPQSSVAR